MKGGGTEEVMGYRETYEAWLANPYFDEATHQELLSLEGNEKEIEDRFYMDLKFGTAGLRGGSARRTCAAKRG